MLTENRPSNEVLIGGIEKRTIEIRDYDPVWPQIFEAHAKTITGALGAAALQIEHFGSTSVPSLAAKPIVDMLLVVENSADEAAYLPQLEAAAIASAPTPTTERSTKPLNAPSPPVLGPT